MRRPLLLTVFALLAAATSPAQTFVFKGERWEINDPFKLDNSIPPKPVVDPKKGVINVVKGTVDLTSNKGGFPPASRRPRTTSTAANPPRPSTTPRPC